MRRDLAIDATNQRGRVSREARRAQDLRRECVVVLCRRRIVYTSNDRPSIGKLRAIKDNMAADAQLTQRDAQMAQELISTAGTLQNQSQQMLAAISSFSMRESRGNEDVSRSVAVVRHEPQVHAA
jgi:hypothetical protein